jgi:hypothetical protein
MAPRSVIKARVIFSAGESPAGVVCPLREVFFIRLVITIFHLSPEQVGERRRKKSLSYIVTIPNTGVLGES